MSIEKRDARQPHSVGVLCVLTRKCWTQTASIRNAARIFTHPYFNEEDNSFLTDNNQFAQCNRTVL